MKISGPGSVGGTAATGKAGARPGGGAFSLGAGGSAGGVSSAAPASGLSGVASLDALLAMQDIGGPLERRKRAVRRAGRILDVLDEVKIALLDGGIPPMALERLTRAVREERAAIDDDPRLSGLLNEIETRAAVELAKLRVAERGSFAT
ncbi:MAG: flagellar assembly protein FliX [Caulobacter sp.]|nr:flagellar assembly protein FliX [Caulobacter sp.]